MDGPDTIIDGSDQITIEGHSNLSTDADDSNLLLQNIRNVKAESAGIVLAVLAHLVPQTNI